MFNDTWNTTKSVYPESLNRLVLASTEKIASRQAWWVFAWASFLVSVPVFIQAPLVRQLPLLSLAITVGWLWLGLSLLKRPGTRIWGDLLIGFSWSWLAGSIFWGWLRWEPLIHLPIEAIGLPFALWYLWEGKRQKAEVKSENSDLGLITWRDLLLKGQVGNLFYLGSLFGTAVTDLYFYLTGLISHWRQLMQVDPALATAIFQSAIAQVRTPWGTAWAVVLASLLLGVSLLSLRTQQIHWWAFAGAVLSTIFVDSLFFLVASLA